MNRISLIFLALGLIFILGCTQQIETPQALVKDISPTESNTVNVNIEDFSFNPATITIKKGTVVTWIQKDSVKHTATSDDGIFDSGLLSKGQTWSYTFNEAGIFKYHCTPHPYMKGTIVVE